MTIKEYTVAEEFLKAYESILLEREAVSQLLLYNAYRNTGNNHSAKALFGAVTNEDKPILLFCNTLPYSLTIYATQQEGIQSGSAYLADFLVEHNIIIEGIIARQEVCQSFMDRYKKLTNTVFSQKLDMDIMEIRQVNEVKPVEGLQRLAVQEDARLIADWIIEYEIEALRSEMDYEAALEEALRFIKEKKVYVYENTSKAIVTMAVVARRLLHGVAIAYVFTPEEFRGKGYAAANIYFLSKQLLEKDCEFCTLFVDKKNPLSYRAYEKVGYQVLENCLEYKMFPAEA